MGPGYRKPRWLLPEFGFESSGELWEWWHRPAFRKCAVLWRPRWKGLMGDEAYHHLGKTLCYNCEAAG